MRYEGLNRVVGVVSLLSVLGLFSAYSASVEAQSSADSLLNRLRPIKALDADTCSLSVPDNFALMETSDRTMAAPTDRQVARLSAKDVLTDSELLDYLASRAAAPAQDAQMHGMVSIEQQDSGATFSINGAVSINSGYVGLKVSPVSANKVTQESERGGFVVAVHDKDGLAIDRRNYSLPQIVYVLEKDEIQERIVDVELIECESLVNWGFTVSEKTFVLSPAEMPFNWLLRTDIDADNLEISDGEGNTQKVGLK